MPEALKCPDCAAPLDAPADNARTMKCPYCNATVMLDGASHSKPDDFGSQIGSLVGKAMEMAQVTQHLRAGNKIQAIKVYRQMHNVDLHTAKMAVERMEAGNSATNVDMRVAQMANTGAKVGIFIAVFVAVFVVIIVSVVLKSVHQATSKIPKVVIPHIPNINIPSRVTTATPTTPAFANQVMEFGSEGIGAGQFKDARSVAVDGKGNIYVAEYSGGRVQVFDADGKFQKLWSLGKNEYVPNLACMRDGTLLAVTSGNIRCFEGGSGKEFGKAQTTNGEQHESYNDVCVALTGDLYAVDEAANILILNHDGQIQKTIPVRSQLDADYSFDRIAVSGTGDIYLLSRNKGVFKFSPEGKYINRFGGGDEDDPASKHTMSFNIAIDGQGRVYLSGNGPSIRVFSPSGTLIDSIGGHDVCFGIAINDKNEIFGCFRNKHTVRKFVLAKK